MLITMLSSTHTLNATLSQFMFIPNITLEHSTTIWRFWSLVNQSTSAERRTSTQLVCPTSTPTSHANDAGRPDGEKTTGSTESIRTFWRKLTCPSLSRTRVRISWDKRAWDTITCWIQDLFALAAKKAKTLAKVMAEVRWFANAMESGRSLELFRGKKNYFNCAINF